MNVFAQVQRLRFTPEQVSETGGHRLDWRQRIVQLVAQHTQQSLPRLAFFFAQRLTQIRQYQQLVRQAAFAKDTTTHTPAANAAGKNHLQDLVTVRLPRLETNVETKLLAGSPQQACRRLSQQFLTGPVNQPQSLIRIKSKDSEIDLRHHGAQQRGGFHRSQPLLAQRLAQFVDFEHDLAQGVATRGTPTANRIVAF